MWQSWQTKKGEKVKLWQNLSCDKTQIVTKLKLRQKWSCDKTKIGKKSNCEEKLKKKINVTKLKLWQNLRTQIMTKLKKSNSDKTLNMTNLNLWRKNLN